MSTALPKLHEQNQESPEGTIYDPTMVVAYGKAATPTLNISWNGIVEWLKLRLDLVPAGTIAICFTNSIPSGWALCNGQGGRPNLNGRFPIGYDPSDSDYNAIGKTGGSKTVALNADNLPVHSHSVAVPVLTATNQEANPFMPDISFGTYLNIYTGRNKIEKTTSSVGGALAHENRPKFKTVNFIIKL